MIALKIITYVALSMMVTVVTVQVNSSPVNDDLQWIVAAQNSIKNSLSEVESYGVDNAYIKIIANAQFDIFTKLAENGLAKLINQTKMTNSEEVTTLKTQFMKWSEGLEKLNNQSDINDERPTKALAKFLITIDFVSNEVVGFDKYNNFESPEAKQIVKELRLLLRKSVDVLVENTESMKIQISGLSKIH
ncbi:Hypothetical protein CINCED_3A012959 [Cinara cedri]|uniref:Uncharacterized protein n=1 Tax=Cinara cedri TaxID=506608 RepID=A0A5E4M003_9HEMI|nr:Hypothetical protein CINCED_3A012959 [Cinara cedri]